MPVGAVMAWTTAETAQMRLTVPLVSLPAVHPATSPATTTDASLQNGCATVKMTVGMALMSATAVSTDPTSLLELLHIQLLCYYILTYMFKNK